MYLEAFGVVTPKERVRIPYDSLKNMKQIKLMILKQTGEKSVKRFTEEINIQLKTIPNSRVITAFMPNINRLYVIIEYDVED